MKISRRIQELRIQNGVSPGELGGEIGLTGRYLCRVEEGYEVPSLTIIERLADALGVPVYQLFYGDGDRILTPWLTPRRTLEDLAREYPGQKQTRPSFALKLIASFDGIVSRGQEAALFTQRLSAWWRANIHLHWLQKAGKPRYKWPTPIVFAIGFLGAMVLFYATIRSSTSQWLAEVRKVFFFYHGDKNHSSNNKTEGSSTNK